MTTRILVVDDDTLVVRLLSWMLQQHGYDVQAACNGEEGLVMAHTYKPDLIILDIMMPGLDGYQVCQKLKADPTTADITVMMLTAKGQIDERTSMGKLAVSERMHGFAVGASDFISKPVQAAVLLKRVEALLWSG